MHCSYCDGAGEPKQYVEEAIKKGFSVIGFSSHTPVPIDNCWTMKEERMQEYLDNIEELKKEYSEKIEIYTGLETDYFEGDNRNIFNTYKVDYQIGSVHFLKDYKTNNYYTVDGNKEDFEKTLYECFEGDIKQFASNYYHQIIKMLEEYTPEILGHLDVIKKNNGDGKYFLEEEQWYRELIEKVLDVVKDKGIIVEVNTGGITRGYIQEPYPSKWILAECKKREIPVMVNSDAHSVENIDGCFDLAYSILKEVGYRELAILKDGKWGSTNF